MLPAFLGALLILAVAAPAGGAAALAAEEARVVGVCPDGDEPNQSWNTWLYYDVDGVRDPPIGKYQATVTRICIDNSERCHFVVKDGLVFLVTGLITLHEGSRFIVGEYHTRNPPVHLQDAEGHYKGKVAKEGVGSVYYCHPCDGAAVVFQLEVDDRFVSAFADKMAC